MLVLLSGLAMSVRLCGLASGFAKPTLARLLGRLLPSSLLPPRFDTGPKLRRLMPEVLMRETCLGALGVSSVTFPIPLLAALTVLPPVRLRLRIVTPEGT
jgi:hypothetical protein